MDITIENTDCIVLAGGKGTRLRSVVWDTPKPMAPINGIPFLRLLLDHLAEGGIERFTLATGYKSELVKAYFYRKRLNYHIQYSHEKKALGTGGAILQALKKTDSEKVLIVNGDTFFKIDIQEFFNKALTTEKEGVLALKRIKNSNRYGSVKLSGNQIEEFEEKSFKEEALINSGIYLLDKAAFLEQSFPQKFSLEKEYLEPAASKGLLAGIELNGYFIDIGIPKDYERAQSEFKDITNQYK